MCDKCVVCSYRGLCIQPVPVHTCVCRVASPSVSSGSSLRSSTWLIQAPCPFCWRRTTVCTTTTSGSHKDPLTSLCSGTHFLFKRQVSIVVSSVLGIIIILITVRLRRQLIYQITSIQLFNTLCVCVRTYFAGGLALGPGRRCWDGSFQRLSSVPCWTVLGPLCSAALSLTVQTLRARLVHMLLNWQTAHPF